MLVGLAGRGLAQATGVSQSTLSRAERGHAVLPLPEVTAWVGATGMTRVRAGPFCWRWPRRPPARCSLPHRAQQRPGGGPQGGGNTQSRLTCCAVCFGLAAGSIC